MSQPFNVGEKLKALRDESGLTLRELSQKSGVSTTQISEIERDLTSPTFATLMKLISAFGQETSVFFESPQTKKISLVRKDERSLIVDKKNKVKVESLTRGIVESKLKVMIVHPLPGQEDIPGGYEHAGEELIYVIRGRVQVKLDGTPHILEAGDSIHFRGELNHTIKNITDTDAELIAVITPPSY